MGAARWLLVPLLLAAPLAMADLITTTTSGEQREEASWQDGGEPDGPRPADGTQARSRLLSSEARAAERRLVALDAASLAGTALGSYALARAAR
mmetsp:Transcript_58736/g.188878  ORF Transcript_58736/g.188878 Transcript_58736/m.188878 type:complete len:94 (+) Transcript_58736:68-349(+)